MPFVSRRARLQVPVIDPLKALSRSITRIVLPARARSRRRNGGRFRSYLISFLPRNSRAPRGVLKRKVEPLRNLVELLQKYNRA